MKQTLKASLAAGLIVAQAVGLPARPRKMAPKAMAADLAYQPASPTAALADREASWRAMAFRRLDQSGLAWRGEQLINETAQRRYMMSAGASQALDLLDQCHQDKRNATMWISAAPAAGAVAGAIAGGIIGNQGPGTDVVPFGNVNPLAGVVIGAVAGVAAGFAIGLPMRLHELKEAKATQAKALDSFNKKLFNDLRLTVEPAQGGGAVGVGARF